MSATRESTTSRPALRLVGAAELEAPLADQPREIDPRDFDQVFRRYAPYIARIALRLLGNDSEVDDLVQDVFLEAHRGLFGLRDAAALGGWLARRPRAAPSPARAVELGYGARARAAVGPGGEPGRARRGRALVLPPGSYAGYGARGVGLASCRG